MEVPRIKRGQLMYYWSGLGSNYSFRLFVSNVKLLLSFLFLGERASFAVTANGTSTVPLLPSSM